MRIRYFSNMALGLLAAFIVVISLALALGGVEWLAFAAGIVFLSAGTSLATRSGAAHRALNAAMATLGVLVIIESMLATGPTLRWLSFAGGLAVLAITVAGLTLHELTTERVVHSLAVTPTPAREPELAA